MKIHISVLAEEPVSEIGKISKHTGSSSINATVCVALLCMQVLSEPQKQSIGNLHAFCF
jgi:hypothetical protein